MAYSAKELAESMRTVRKNTIRIAQDIPAEKYSFSPSPDTRTVAQLLTHIAVSYRLQHQIQAVERRTTLQGFDFPKLFTSLVSEEQQARTKEEIIDLLRREGDKWAGWVETLSDDFLAERVTAPDGSTRSRFEMILSTKEHEMHHRGQLMLIERLLGITPHLTVQMRERMAQVRQQATA